MNNLPRCTCGETPTLWTVRVVDRGQPARVSFVLCDGFDCWRRTKTWPKASEAARAWGKMNQIHKVAA